MRRIDRKGNVAFETEVPVESPLLHPIDFVPNPSEASPQTDKACILEIT
jgi:hypothetical protein